MNLLTELRVMGWRKAIGSILLAMGVAFVCWAGLVFAAAFDVPPIPQ